MAWIKRGRIIVPAVHMDRCTDNFLGARQQNIKNEGIPMKASIVSYDIVALGELLIDFCESGISRNANKLFEQNPGGAPANMLTAATKLGSKTAFIGKVGKDMHGEFLKKTLKPMRNRYIRIDFR